MNLVVNSSTGANPMESATLAGEVAKFRNHLQSILFGKVKEIDLVVACLLSRGHLLLDDLPGTGKTTLAKAVASGIGGELSRVQCTPDLMPADITGFSVFNQKSREFEFNRGPVFSDVLLADELNRTTPRTQSALLEAMAERQVTVDGTGYALPSTFFVIATQNPIDSHGAYPLPEAQLDRFAIKIRIGYPDREAQKRILEREVSSMDQREATDVSESALGIDQLKELQSQVRKIEVHTRVSDYLIDLSEATRNDEAIELGISPRGMMHWQAISQAWAMLKGRDFVTPTDIEEVMYPVLSVRLLTRGESVDESINRILKTVPTPEYR